MNLSLVSQAAPRFKLGPDYKFDSKSSPGLITDTLVFPNGSKLIINFPNYIAVGDTFSGTMQTEAAGKDERQRARNQAEMEKSLLLLGGQAARATEKIFTRTIPPQINAEESFIILKVNGKEVVSAQLPISQTAAPQPANTQLPTCGQTGKNVVVVDHCNGVIAANDSCSISGTPLQPLAESPRMRVLQNISNTVGPTQINYTEQGKETSGPFQNFGVGLSAGNLNLLKGQQTTLVVTVTGLTGMQQNVPLDLVNESRAVINMEGGNAQHFDIHQADVAADGTYKIQRGLTGIRPGAFEITATVECPPPPPMPPPVPGTTERPTPSPSPFMPTQPLPSPSPLYTTILTTKACILTKKMEPGPGIKGDAFAPLSDPISTSNESIPLVVTASDADQLIQTCSCPPGSQSKSIGIADSVNYEWTPPTVGKLNAGGPASLYEPPDIKIGEKITAVVLVEVTDSGQNGKDDAKKVKFTITIERPEECQYKREVKIEKNFGGGGPAKPPPGKNECEPAKESWDPAPALQGEADDTVKLCAGEQIVLRASGSDSDILNLKCVSGNCGSPTLAVPSVDEMKYTWKVLPKPGIPSGTFLNPSGGTQTKIATNGQHTSVIYQAPEKGGDYTVTVDIENNGGPAPDPKVSKTIHVKVYKLDLEIEGMEGLSKEEKKCKSVTLPLNGLKKITLSKEPAEGTMTLKVSGGDKIKIWEDKDKREKAKSLTFPATEPKELWVEGASAGDVALVLQSADVPCEDKVKLTVTDQLCRVKLVLESVQYLNSVLRDNADNIGENWKFKIKVDDQEPREINEPKLVYGDTNLYKKVVFEGTPVDKAHDDKFVQCNAVDAISFFPVTITATEIGRFIGADSPGSADGELAFEYDCTREQAESSASARLNQISFKSRRQKAKLSIHERSIKPGKEFSGKIAQLEFTFRLDTECVR